MPAVATIANPEDGATVHKDLTEKSNGPDRSEFLFLVGQLDKADDDLKEQQKIRKKIRQHATNRGLNLEMTDRARKERDKNDGTTIQNLKEFRRYCEYLQIPIGQQINFFDGPASAETQADLGDKAYADGFERGIAGKNPDDQRWLPNSPEGQRHFEGWTAGQAELQAKFMKMNSEMAEQERAAAAKKEKKKPAPKVDAAAAEDTSEETTH
jgi:hypothetical protein